MSTSKKVSLLKGVPLSERCKQVLLGGLLGDSSLTMQKGYRNARYQFRHSVKQEEYFLWKANIVKEVATKNLQYTKPDGASKTGKVNFISRADESLTSIYDIVSPNRAMLIDTADNWLDYLTEEALLVWWLDDGSLQNKRKKGVLCCEGFPLETIELLKEYFERKWGIVCSVMNMKRTQGTNNSVRYTKSVYHRLLFTTTELKKLFALIMPLLETPSLLYKFALEYRDPIHRERWISTMKEALPQFHLEIDSLMNK